ncbi:tRNA (N(6)-L-threonylcarbamoyladenosine(37)-C(2))-methylthiotransferase MtaB, partial [Paracoccus thiocyanatus]
AGDAALARHLQAEVGAARMVLTEGPRLGRTEHFAEVTFERDLPEGSLMELRIAGHDGQRLRA